MLGDIGQNHVRADRRHLIEARLAELAFDVVLGGEAETAVGLDARLARSPARLGGEHLGHIRLVPAIVARPIFRDPIADEQFGGAHLRLAARERELHALLLPDRAPETHALLRVARRLNDEPPRTPDAL